jgi:hypothetical protein
MPKIGRTELQRGELNPAGLLAFHCAKQFREFNKDAPPLRWCWLVGMFALQGEHEDLHKVYPDFLRVSFLKRKDWTIFGLDWMRSYFDSKFLFAGKSRADSRLPKEKNHAITAALFACFKYRGELESGSRTLDDQTLSEVAKELGLSVEWKGADLTKAVNFIKELRAEYYGDEWRQFEDDFF